MNKLPKPKPTCPYCGIRPGTEKDHVIADCFYTTKPSVGNVTVKVCHTCADLKAKDDSYLAHHAQGYHASQFHPVARELSQGKLLRAAAGHQSDYAREIYEALKDVDLNTMPDDELRTFSVDKGRLERILRLITRGLYAYYLKPKQLSQECFVDVRRIGDEQLATMLPRLFSLTPEGPHILGDEVAVVRYGVNPGDATNSIWLLSFYRGIFFTMVTTSNPALLD